MPKSARDQRFIVNIGGRSKDHYIETLKIAEVVADAVREAQNELGRKVELTGKNGGLTGSMKAFGKAYEKKGIPWIPVLTEKLDTPKYAPKIARKNPRKITADDNTQRLGTIVKHEDNKLLIVTSGGSGTLEEVAAAICEIEWRIKWSKETQADPFHILVAGDVAVKMWRPILQAVFLQLADTHPYVERRVIYFPCEYIKKGLLGQKIKTILADK